MYVNSSVCGHLRLPVLASLALPLALKSSYCGPVHMLPDIILISTCLVWQCSSLGVSVDKQQLPVIQSSVIVRCRSCRTYINPFVTFIDLRRWKCNLCFRVNEC